MDSVRLLALEIPVLKSTSQHTHGTLQKKKKQKKQEINIALD